MKASVAVEDKLTDQAYWEDYYKQSGRNRKHIVNVYSYYDDFWKMLCSYLNDSPKTLIELRRFPFCVHQKLNVAQKFIYNVHRFVVKKFGNAYLEKHPSRFFSSSIVAVFEKS